MKASTIVFTALVAAAVVIITQEMAQTLSATGEMAQTRSGREDCASYDPSTLRLTVEGDRGWLISRDDGARFMVLDTKEDADVMMGVFKAQNALCYVGRNNKRPNRDRYVYHYWK